MGTSTMPLRGAMCSLCYIGDHASGDYSSADAFREAMAAAFDRSLTQEEWDECGQLHY